jgi:putative DNA primase/helicase
MDFNQIIQNFQAAMLENGITPPDSIIADGQLKRFYIQGDKRGSKNGWYTVFVDNTPCGIFGSWKEGVTHKWCFKKREYMSNCEYKEYKQQMEAAKLQRAEERASEQAEAARLAEHIFYGCPPADPAHPYLVRKRIKPFYAHQKGSYLILPIIDFDGNFHSLQHIPPNVEDNKWFLSNGAIAGHFIPIQHQPVASRTTLICEGLSTGGALAQAYPDACVIAACNAGNLKSVAMSIRQHLPESEIIIGADIDQVGLLKAREAARAAKARIIKPKFPSGVSKKLNDFCDLFCLLRTGELEA